MKTQQSAKGLLVVSSVLALSGFVPAVHAQFPPVPFPSESGVPTVITNTQTTFQQQTHFLTFLGSFIPESAATAKAYYKAINPTGSKENFTAWLVNAGFIRNASEWNPSGPQRVVPQGSTEHGLGIINADSHVIALNAADLGFVRNQFVRCKPSCTARNPIIYTYLENYPVAPFAVGGSGFPFNSGFPTAAEAQAAIASAQTRPLGVLGDPNAICPSGEAGVKTCVERIADVAFEWAPPPSNPISTARYGQLYAYVFSHPAPGTITETITVPPGLVGAPIVDFTNPTNTSLTVQAGDPFPPNLDFRGFKQHPGVCFICHGGEPKNLLSNGTYPRQGKVDGFRLLPLDVRNLLFGIAPGTSLAEQEVSIKQYNKDVLLTVPRLAEIDDQGVTRVAHLREVILGWYEGFPGDLNMTGAHQNGDFLPRGWREPVHGGTAPAGSEQLYLHTVAPSCRSCHFNRELSLDFGTVQNFDQESDVLELALKAECDSNNPDPKLRAMPLALLTFQRLWGAQVNPQTMADGFTITDPIVKLKSHFGFTPAGYCASHP